MATEDGSRAKSVLALERDCKECCQLFRPTLLSITATQHNTKDRSSYQKFNPEAHPLWVVSF